MKNEAETELEPMQKPLDRARALVLEAEARQEDEPRPAMTLAAEAREILSPFAGAERGAVTLLARALVTLSNCSGRLNNSEQAIAFAETALETLGQVEAPEIRARALNQLAWVLSQAGDFDGALARIREGMEVADGAEDPLPLRARLLCSSGGVRLRLGEARQAVECYGRAIEIWKERGDRLEEARARGTQAVALSHLGKHARAIETHLQVLAIHRESGDPRRVAITLHNLANVYCRIGSHAEAIPHVTEALRLAREIGDREGEASSNQLLAEACRHTGRNQEAKDHVRRALDLFQAIGCPEGAAHCHATAAALALEEGDIDRARAGLEECLSIAREIGALELSARTLGSLAEIHVSEGDHQAALDLVLESEETASARDIIESRHDLLHRAYQGIGRLDKALEHLRSHYELVLEREREDHDQRIAELRVEHELAEARLKAETAEERAQVRGAAALNAIVENTPDVAISAYDTDGVVQLWNHGAQAVFGWTEEEARGSSAGELYLDEDDARRFGAVLRRLDHAGKAIAPWESRFRARDGTEGTAFTTLFPVVDPSGERLLVRMDVDITARERARRELETSEAKYRRAVENMSDALVIDDRRGRIVFANDRFLEIFEIEREAAGSLTIEDWIAPDWRARVREFHELRMRGETAPGRFEMLSARRDGAPLWLEVTVVPIAEDGEIRGTQALLRDISERKRAEERLLVSEKMSALGLLVSGVAHELNNPMTGVLGFSELLLRSIGLPEKARRHVEKIHQEAVRSRKIVDNLLTFARHRKPERRQIHINEVLEQVLDLRSYEMRVNNIEVTKSLGADLAPVSGDAHQLHQVFLNIVHNSEQAMVDAHGKGRLQVRTSCVHSRNVLQITFEDDGPGMNPEQLAKALDPFFTTKPEGKGTGLGLAISHGIVVEHGGSIAARAASGRGAIFTVELPVSEKDDSMVDASAAGSRGTKIGRKRILVIDDEPLVVELLRETLEAMGHSVVVAFDGRSALKRLRDEPLDGVICDLRMPGMNGTDVYHQCKESRPELARRFLVISGDVSSTDSRQLPDGEWLPHLPKPFLLEELEVAVDALFS